jgi:acetyltransferase-like isoleucine patch superfamily enzyme
VWIAAQCFIGPGVTIHDNAMVGARAVVSTDLPAGMVAAGNPARVVKRRIMKPEAD